MRKQTRKGHNFESIQTQFSQVDIENLQQKQVFNEKWIILKNLGARGDAICYDVADKIFKEFGVLYLEIGIDGVSSVADQVEFSQKQYTQGNSHRFSKIIDTGLINNHVFFMVLETRPGPTLQQILEVSPVLSFKSVSFLAIDLMATAELLIASGYVLRNFDASQWNFDVKSRTFYLADTTDIAVLSDKRYRLIDVPYGATRLNWKSDDLTYAPISFTKNDRIHRTSEIDMIESFLFLIFDLAGGKLPWKNEESAHKISKLKKEFLTNPPNIPDLKTNERQWLNHTLQNMIGNLKEAWKKQSEMEQNKFPVRDGAWCPNGARAGALISTVNYLDIVDDFHKVLSGGRPKWNMHWRDVQLDWEIVQDQSKDSLALLAQIEKRELSLEIRQEADRLAATRVHSQIMEQQKQAELNDNEKQLDDFLKEEEEVQEIERIEEEVERVKPAQKRKIKKEKESEDRETSECTSPKLKEISQEMVVEEDDDEIKIEEDW